MLKLLAMLTTGKALLVFGLLFGNLFNIARAGEEVFIDTPAEGEYLQGAVTISGGINVNDFSSYEAAFAYEDGREKPVWFLIRRDINQVQKGTLAVWDTTTITDGEYRIQLLVQTGDGRQLIKEVRHLHVSNYSPVPGGISTEAAQPAAQKANNTASAVRPAPIEIPSNPAVLSENDLKSSLLKGILGALGLLLLLGLYLLISRRIRR